MLSNSPPTNHIWEACSPIDEVHALVSPYFSTSCRTLSTPALTPAHVQHCPVVGSTLILWWDSYVLFCPTGTITRQHSLTPQDGDCLVWRTLTHDSYLCPSPWCICNLGCVLKEVMMSLFFFNGRNLSVYLFFIVLCLHFYPSPSLAKVWVYDKKFCDMSPAWTKVIWVSVLFDLIKPLPSSADVMNIGREVSH